MFLNGLKYDQRKYFLGMARAILNVDGGIDTEEEEYLRALCREMDLSFSDSSSFNRSDLCNVFVDLTERKIVILELIALAIANNEMHIEEKKYIESVLFDFGMSPLLFNTVEEIISSYKKVQQTIITFISE